VVGADSLAAAAAYDRPVSEPRALIVDFGGVLTSPLAAAMAGWCESDGIDPVHFRAVMRGLLGPAGAGAAARNPVHALERGELQAAEFERQLAGLLRTRDGQPVVPDGLLARMFAGFAGEPSMVELVRRAHDAGIPTALLSNSWGLDYDREDWDGLFDVVVISAEVKMRKPEPEIYLHTAAALRLEPADCVFVDDLPPNVRAAVAVGMTGILHETAERTREQLERLFPPLAAGRSAAPDASMERT
jgi:epoxide hydrolase-like predicted phosphatase